MLKSVKKNVEPFDLARMERGLRGPGWRWQIASQAPFSHWDSRMDRYDDHIRRTCHFLDLVGHSPVGAKQAETLYPDIAAAVAINEDAAKVADLKIAVFGDLSPAEIVRRMGIDAAALATWEALFYDARESRKHIGWIRVHIVDSELAAGNVDLATKLQLVAGVGPLGATTILDAGSRAPIDEGERLFRRKIALHLKFERALAMTEGPKYHVHFVRHFTNLKMQECRLKIQEKKLAEKCNAALRRHELAEIRAQEALERAKARAAKEARKAEEITLIKEGEQYARELEAAREIAMEQAEQKDARTRAAASPLARLRWKVANVSPIAPPTLNVVAESEVGVPVELPATVPFRAAERTGGVSAPAAQTA